MIELQLLGGLCVDAAGLSPNARVRRRHPLALLALIAAAPTGISRDRVMAMLWPDSDTERASNSLRQTLYSLRRDLGDDVIIAEGTGRVELDRSNLAVDLWAFREALAGGALETAVEAYRGPFLDGFQIAGVPEFSYWADTERARIERQYVGALDALARQAETKDCYDEAVAWRRRQAAAEPFSSRIALALLKALDAAGDRPGALQYAAVHENLVRTQLDAAPDPQVMAFVAGLRRVDAPSVARADVPAAAASVPPLTQPAPGPEAVGTVSYEGRRNRVQRHVGMAAAAAFLLLAAIAAVPMLSSAGGTGPSDGAEDFIVVLASGAQHSAGRDSETRLIACSGAACPPGELPQNAFVVPTHVAYTAPVAGTSFIAQVPDGTTRPPPGFACCTTAVFENEFTLPPEAVTGRIHVAVLADNQASVAINGLTFGDQAERDASWNFGGPPAEFSARFNPDPSGTNRLRVTLWNGGGAAGLHYHAVVTYETEHSLTQR